jgi:hypothetical protein
VLKDSLAQIEQETASTESGACRLFQICRGLESAERGILMRIASNPKVSNRVIHKALRDEGIVIDRAGLSEQRKCMRTEACECDWDSLS